MLALSFLIYFAIYACVLCYAYIVRTFNAILRDKFDLVFSYDGINRAKNELKNTINVKKKEIEGRKEGRTYLYVKEW